MKIEEVLIENPRSYFYDIIFNFSIIIEKMKINKCLLLDKSEYLNKIYQSKDLSKTYQKKTKFTIEQQINAFNTLYDPSLEHTIRSYMFLLFVEMNIDYLSFI